MQVATVGKELISGAIVKAGGTTPPVVRGTPSGVAQQFTTGAATVSFLDLGLPLGASVDLGRGTPATWVGVFYANTTAGVAIAERNDNNAVDIGWGFGYVAGSGGGANFGLGFVKEWGSVNTRKSINENVAAGLNTLVVTYDGGFLASGINIYLNGVLGTVKGTADGSGSGSTDAGQNLYIGRQRYDTSKAHDGSILLAGAYRRIWTAAEVLSFHKNPWQLFAAPAREMLVEAAAAGGGVSAALTSVTGTGSVGTVAPSTDKAVTGNSGTGAAGTVAPSTSTALTGNSGTGSVGTVSPSTAAALAGTSGTGSAGTVSPSVTIALSGVSATGTAGTVTPQSAAGAALSGVSGTGSAGTVGPTSDKALTGTTGTASVGTVVPGTSAGITGNTATGSVGSIAVSSSVGLTGVSGTSSAGTVGASVTVALSGVSGTGTAGTVVAVTGGVTADLSGVSGTGQAGSPGVNVTIALSGVSGTGIAGNVSLPSSGGGNAWGAQKAKRRQQVQSEVNRLNLEIIRAEIAKKAKAVEADEYDDDEDVLMLLL